MDKGKKVFSFLIVPWLVLVVMVGVVFAASEVYAPKLNNSGTIGKSGKAWLRGYFKDLSVSGVDYTWPTADGTAAQVLSTNGSGTLSWSAGGSTAWDDVADPDANCSITMGTYTNTLTSASVAADGYNFINTGDFGDISVMKIQQMTGNPTNGTMLEILSADTNVDSIVVTNSAADLTADATLLSLGFTDDGDANGIFINCLDNASGDSQFKVADDGDTTIAGDLSVTGTATIGTIEMDSVTAATVGQTLALNGDTVGGVNICSTSTGGITLGDDITVSDTKDMTIGEGSLTIDNDQTTETALTITSDATTAGGGIAITSAATTTNGKGISVTSNDVTTGDLVYLESSAAGMTTGNFINCYNGATTVFEVGLYGATTIAGNAATDIITMTAGNLQMTNGDVDMDEGKLEIDTTTNESTYVKRNQGVTTTPVVEIEETAAAADNPALLIDQNATAAASYGLEIDSAGGTCALVSAEAVTGDGVIFSTPASYTGQLITVNETLVGTTGEGIVDIKTTANQATGSTLVRLDSDTGTLAGATDGFLLSLDDDSGASATSYAMKIDSASNEALHVATGKSLFDEAATFTLGIVATSDLDVDFSANTEEMNITYDVADYAAGSGALTIYDTTAAGPTNASYLLRLAMEADGDAQGHFILCEDNSTGAAANGDDKFSVDTGGLTKSLGGIAPGNATDSYMKTDTVELSNADIKALRATPKDLVAAPGAGYVIEFVSAVLILDYGSEVLTESVDNMIIQFGSGTDLTATIESTSFIDAAADAVAVINAADVATAAGASIANDEIELFNTGDGEFAGNASNDTTMTVKVTYWVHATGL